MAKGASDPPEGLQLAGRALGAPGPAWFPAPGPTQACRLPADVAGFCAGDSRLPWPCLRGTGHPCGQPQDVVPCRCFAVDGVVWRAGPAPLCLKVFLEHAQRCSGHPLWSLGEVFLGCLCLDFSELESVVPSATPPLLPPLSPPSRAPGDTRAGSCPALTHHLLAFSQSCSESFGCSYRV